MRAVWEFGVSKALVEVFLDFPLSPFDNFTQTDFHSVMPATNRCAMARLLDTSARKKINRHILAVRNRKSEQIS
jgi:hypothetical protein